MAHGRKPFAGWILKFEYTGSWLWIVVEIFRLRPEFSKYRVISPRKAERCRRKMLRRVIHDIKEKKS